MFYVDEFLNYLEHGCYRRHTTLRAYRALLSRFEQYSTERGVAEVGAVDSRLVRDFIAALQSHGRTTQFVAGEFQLLFKNQCGRPAIPSARPGHQEGVPAAWKAASIFGGTACMPCFSAPPAPRENGRTSPM